MTATTAVYTPMMKDLPMQLTVERSGVVFVHRFFHPILSKQDMAIHFGCSRKVLRKKVFTDQVLEDCGILPEWYDSQHSVFTLRQSQGIYDALGIVWLRTNQKI